MVSSQGHRGLRSGSAGAGRSRLGRGLRAVAAAGVAALTLGLAACGGDNGEGEQVDGKTQLTWRMWTGSDAEVQAWKHLADMVTEKYPDIEITFETASFEDYWTKLSAQASSGELPCILGIQSLRTAGFGNLVIPLEDLMAKYDVKSDEFDQSIMEGLQYDGKQVAIPYDFGPWMIYFNKTAFAAAGVPEPKIGWTVDDFLAAAKALTNDGMYGFAQDASAEALNPWATVISGVQAVNEDGKPDITSAEYLKALEWYTELITTQKVSAEVSAGANATSPIDNFIAGNTAMALDGPWNVINTNNTVDFDMGIAPIPAGPAGGTSITAGSGFGVSKSCAAPDEAFKAISVIIGPEAQQYLGEQGRALPARTAEQKYWLDNAVPGAAEALNAALADADPFRVSENWQQISSLFNQYSPEVLNGAKDAATVMQDIQQQAG